MTIGPILLITALIGILLIAYWAKTVVLYDDDENPIIRPGIVPVDFPEQNVIIAKDQPQYRPLPAYTYKGPEGERVTCWQIPLRQRLKLLLTGKLWVSVLTFNQPLQPLLMSAEKYHLLPKPETQTPNSIKA